MRRDQSGPTGGSWVAYAACCALLVGLAAAQGAEGALPLELALDPMAGLDGLRRGRR